MNIVLGLLTVFAILAILAYLLKGAVKHWDDMFSESDEEDEI